MRRRLAPLVLGIAGICLAGCSASGVASPGEPNHLVMHPDVAAGSTVVMNPVTGHVLVVVPPHHSDAIIVMDPKTGHVRWDFPPTPTD
jgi:hypothetical protein